MRSTVLGVDYGTDSVRSVLVDTSNGQELAAAVFAYPRWAEGKYCDAPKSQFRQHPLDYVEGLTATIRECLTRAGADAAASVKAISVDTTGSSPVAVDANGTPLALLPAFRENPNAMFVLWKDHTSVKEAAQINEHARKFNTDYLQFVGGIYSSEWYWAKLLHILRVDTSVRDACYGWVEHCDWIPFLLTGGQSFGDLKRSICSAGHKALWAADYGGMPPDEFFSSLDPLLKGYADKQFDKALPADQPAGLLSAEWAEKLGLTTDVVVGIGAFDAHMGAVGGQIEPYYLSKVMGTSTCDMLVAPLDDMSGVLVKGICGQVPGSVVPGMLGMEAGQSAFGDTYAWFRKLVMDFTGSLLRESTIIDAATAKKLEAEMNDKCIAVLAKQAAALPLGEDDELAVDWLNGRRTPDADQSVKGSITGLHLGTDAARLFKALVEATCFGARAIVERFRQEGVPVKGLIGLGGVARKSPYIMQTMANVMQMPIRIHRSEQTCAAGAAMFAATAAGIYPHVEAAMEKMGQGFDIEYFPDTGLAHYYDQRYARYQVQGAFTDKNKKS